ncbi:N-acetylmuramoyl-L-alanine amidase [Legionella impletisoli]|uniref:N-acetylmuramoyl-L-alanine amidase AmiC n=1 Tax=Legionella impletisoli TaxID=343510 RepID=A0A917JV58_9GAMM|nr:N-acetylmuramoyl-L-alanine amidase [Legionella impletisoli]GGI83105.1 N-acetylmuramoyl-L-alanine amidase [Legionella impletisoli]
MGKSIFNIITSFMLISHVAVAAELLSLDIQDEKQTTALIFDFSEPFTYKAFLLLNPARAVVDLPQASSSIHFNRLAQKSSLVKAIRIGHPKKDTLRVVFDLNHEASLSADKAGKRLRLNLTNKRESIKPAIVKAAAQANSLKAPVMVSRSPSRSLRDVVVIIDPGHGGKDPGAIGPTHHLEKNVVLAIALKLKKIIDKQPGMRAVLTRKGDYYVGLRERLDIARKYDGDIFISIHADAFKNRNSNGASVFALSQTGATSEAARWLAEKENYSELGGVNLSELDDDNGVIRSVLIDLSQTATIGASLKMGERVLHSMDNITNLHHEDVEQARFVVLKSPDIPSILVETGFISNPREERNLTSSTYQSKLSYAIFQGVKQYFFDHPPHGTYIEAMARTNKHIVRKGETLGGIAAKYSTSIAKLKELNHLQNEHIVIGQSLIIPNSLS